MATYSTTLGNIFYSLERLGIADILLPFILIFTLVFATLQKTKILGDKKNFNVVVALSIALGVIIPHATNSYPPGGDVVEIINAALPQIALVLVAGLSVMILIGLWGVSPAWKGPLTGIIMLVSFAIVLWIFLGASELINIPRFLDDPETQALIVVLLVFGFIVMAITSEGGKDEKSTFEKFGEFFAKSK